LLARERTLTIFALALLAAALPTLLALGLDDRLLRGVSVWVKPLKFMLSVALFAATTAWFFGLLPAPQRRARSLRVVVWTIVIGGGLEVAYIALQAALGEASHYNLADPLHAALYTAMGLTAMAMTATQPVLAWQIAKHGRRDLAPIWREAVVLGLVLTFVLGAGAGGLLGSRPPPSTAGLAVLGWHAAGDLRPAHFIGMHAQQLLPLAGAALAGWPVRRARRLLAAAALAYVLLWLAAMCLGFAGGQWLAPPVR
jgi:hypothetical protein